MAKRKHPELRVAFDTNILHTGSASDLLNAKVSDLIKQYTNVADLRVTWYLPKIVVLEREYQMLDKGKGLLPSIQKLEKLLGHNLSITEDIIHERIKSAIQKQIDEHSINAIDLDLDKVDWEKIIHNAIYRIPPFQKGDKEKGFRDALIAESFIQLVNDSPKTPQYCRIVFITDDGLLMKTLDEKTKSIGNVKIYNDIEELKGLINTLASEVREELIERIKEEANSYFFEKNDQESLYYRENIFKRIKKLYADKLTELPLGGETRKNETRYVSSPRFFSKKKQRITWKTRIDVVSKAYKSVLKTQPPLPLSGITGLLGNPDFSQGLPGLQTFGLEEEKLIADGKTTFEVTWSILVTTNNKIRNPKIESIDFIEINWEDKIE